MIIPSIDLMKGEAVQLKEGKVKLLSAGNPISIAKKFSVAGELAIIDLDAATGKGSNREILMKLSHDFPCRVGGGIRDLETAIDYLNAGARKIIIGTLAEKYFLEKLPADRLIAALDVRQNNVFIKGWQEATGKNLIDKIRVLKQYVGGFLVTFIEREGHMKGTDIETARLIKEEIPNHSLTVAGGITSPEEIAELDRLGIDAQVGMALYTGRLNLADAISAPLIKNFPNQLWPTVVVDEHGKALGHVWSNLESLREAVKKEKGIYYSRKRGLWEKGLTSGATQKLIRIDLDCDRDTLRFTVEQNPPGFCHLANWTCWGRDMGLSNLERRLKERIVSSDPSSYTNMLLKFPPLLKAKLVEEAEELADACPQEVAWETADLLYFAFVAMVKAGVSLSDVERELDRRSLRVTRRYGIAKVKLDRKN